jgi:hypothetical protein
MVHNEGNARLLRAATSHRSMSGGHLLLRACGCRAITSVHGFVLVQIHRFGFCNTVAMFCTSDSRQSAATG